MERKVSDRKIYRIFNPKFSFSFLSFFLLPSLPPLSTSKHQTNDKWRKKIVSFKLKPTDTTKYMQRANLKICKHNERTKKIINLTLCTKLFLCSRGMQSNHIVRICTSTSFKIYWSCTTSIGSRAVHAPYTHTHTHKQKNNTFCI